MTDMSVGSTAALIAPDISITFFNVVSEGSFVVSSFQPIILTLSLLLWVSNFSASCYWVIHSLNSLSLARSKTSFLMPSTTAFLTVSATDTSNGF